MNATQIGLILLFAAIGFGLGWWLAQPGPPEVTIVVNDDKCWEITQDRKSKKKYIVIIRSSGESIPLEPGKTVTVCEEFDLYELAHYEHPPVDPDPDG